MKEKSKYLMLAGIIKEEISAGVYKSGEKIPGENKLAERYMMSRQTVRQALALLEKDGKIERRQGSGTYVADSFISKARTWNVGVIATYISEYIFPSIMRGIESELTENGFSPILCATQNRVDSERRILEDLMKKSIDGLIVEGTKTALPNPNIRFYQEIEKSGIPVVFFNGYYPVLSDSVYVVMDDRQGGYGAVGSLVKKGHKKIAGIFKSDDIQGMERYSGYIQAIIDNGLEFKDEWVYWFNSENRQYIFTDEKARIIEMFQECTAVVCYNDEIAVKLVNLFKSSGYRIPQDKAIMSFDNSLLSEISSPHLTSLDHPKEILGAVAARKIVSMINGKKEKSVKLEWGISLKDST